MGDSRRLGLLNETVVGRQRLNELIAHLFAPGSLRCGGWERLPEVMGPQSRPAILPAGLQWR
jgi:hypothetical protein